MRLVGLTVENFRCYLAPTSVRFDDLTALVGQNDVGKSTLMDALAIFFDSSDADKDDASKGGNPNQMRITCEFDRFPDPIVIDSDYKTSLASEYILSKSNTLVVRKTYNGALNKPKLTAIEAIALHPTADKYNDLLSLKKDELLKRAKELNVELSHVNKNAIAPIREAIWSSCFDLELDEVPVSLESEGGKSLDRTPEVSPSIRII